MFYKINIGDILQTTEMFVKVAPLSITKSQHGPIKK